MPPPSNVRPLRLRSPFFYNRASMTITGADSSFIPNIPMPAASGGPRTWAEKALTAQFWSYRLSSYLLLNVIEDPAWLALIFC